MRRKLAASVFASAVLGLAGALTSGIGFAPSPNVAPQPTAPAPLNAAAPDRNRTDTIKVRRGDTLVAVLNRQGVERRTSYDISEALRERGADLRRVRTHDELEITWTPEGDPVAVRWEPNPWLAFAAFVTDDGWEAQRTETRPDIRVEAVAGAVTRSLFESVEALGESPQLVIDLVAILESEFDFTADTREGDRFRLLVEKRYAGEQFVEYGRILAAQYRSEEDTLTGIAYEAHDGRYGYYDLEARSLNKAFLRAPLDFTRITSGFTYRRPHPILGGVRPHLAIDYGAPVGTPVRAVADGVVLRAGWNGGNGIQVVLKHAGGYQTIYNHLSKAVVKPGARVEQRRVIGHVGSTGLSTGPHLDYRVSRNGRFVNPLSERFIPGDSLSGAQRVAFTRDAERLVERLDAEAPFD